MVNIITNLVVISISLLMVAVQGMGTVSDIRVFMNEHDEPLTFSAAPVDYDQIISQQTFNKLT